MSNHQKRVSAPEQYPVTRKDGAYVVTAKGPHAAEEGLPLVVVLRDVLGYADDTKDVKELLTNHDVEVNGRVKTDPHVTAGFMDVIGFPRIDEYYRVLLDRNGFVLHEIDADDAARKMARVNDKTTLKGGVTQVNLYDGNNIETDESYSTKSSVLVTLPDLDVEKEVAFEEGNLAYVRSGQHQGTVAEIAEIRERRGMHPTQVVLESDEEEFETVADNVYMIGEDSPEVDIDA